MLGSHFVKSAPDLKKAFLTSFGENGDVRSFRVAEPNPLTPFPYKEGGTEKWGTLPANLTVCKIV
jgi:hypothetical protein